MRGKDIRAENSKGNLSTRQGELRNFAASGGLV
jgi:hypothetical protein